MHFVKHVQLKENGPYHSSDWRGEPKFFKPTFSGRCTPWEEMLDIVRPLIRQPESWWSERGCLLVSEELRRLEHETTPNHNLEVLKNAPEAAALHNIILSWILNELWDQHYFPEPRPLSLDD